MHDVNDELSNLERQRESTQRIVNEIERQIGGLASQLDRSSAELILAEDNLAERRAVLERRLVDIYKRGPLYTFQVCSRPNPSATCSAATSISISPAGRTARW